MTSSTTVGIPTLFHIQYATKLTFCLMSLALMFRLSWFHGEDSCQSLFQAGAFVSDKSWRPKSCMTHKYHIRDINICLTCLPTRLVFINEEKLDTLLNDLTNSSDFYQLLLHFNCCLSEANITSKTTKVHEMISLPTCVMHKNGLDSFTKSLLENLSGYNSQKKINERKIRDNEDCLNKKPTHIIVSIESKSKDFYIKLKEYKNALRKLHKLVQEKLSASIIWFYLTPLSNDFEPKRLSNAHPMEYDEMVLNELSNMPNAFVLRLIPDLTNAVQTLQQSSARSNASTKNDVTKAVFHEVAQLFWNFRCNAHMKFEDASCCRDPEPMTRTQRRCFILIGICIGSTAVLFLFKQVVKCANKSKPPVNSSDPSQPETASSLYVIHSTESDELIIPTVKLSVNELYSLFSLLSQFGLILIYFYLCDRTRIFSNKNKAFSKEKLLIPLIAMLITGLLCTEKTAQTRINHVDVTREWKGFMQIYILIYHFTGSFHVLPAYFWARICVSSYLFLSGYGHFCYFWDQTVSQFSSAEHRFNSFQTLWLLLKRYLDIIYRMNLLVFALCLVMNRDYLMYYFMPLISFWFTVVFLTMAPNWPHPQSKVNRTDSESLPANLPSVNSTRKLSSIVVQQRTRTLCLITLGKLVLLVIVIQVIYQSQFLFHWIFHTGLLGRLLKLDHPKPNVLRQATSAEKRAEALWNLRWSLDRYSTLYGMCFGLVLKWLSTMRWWLEGGVAYAELHGSITSWFQSLEQTKVIQKTILTVIGFIGLGITTIFTFKCTERSVGNELHATFCFIPILSYILTRNSFESVRSRFSWFFAWIGDISLELFIAQYHIWLSADAYGILVILPDWPLLNVLWTTSMFVSVSQELHRLTRALQCYVVPDKPAGLLWRLIWVAVLVVYFNVSLNPVD